MRRELRLCRDEPAAGTRRVGLQPLAGTSRDRALRLRALIRRDERPAAAPAHDLSALRAVPGRSDRLAIAPRSRPMCRSGFATLADVAAIAALQNAVAGALTARFGPGPWSSLVNERGAALSQRHARVRVGRDGKRILTVLRLATKKPWAIDVSC